MKKVFVVLLLLMSVSYGYTQEKIVDSIDQRGDQYLNITNFKNAFKANIGSSTGNDIYIVVNDCYDNSEFCGNHGDGMVGVINSIKVSNNVKTIERSNIETAIKCTTEGKNGRVKCVLDNSVEQLLKKGNIRVWNESNGFPLLPNARQSISNAIAQDKFKRLIKKYDTMYIVSSGNNKEKQVSSRNSKTIINNPLDNLLTVAQFGIDLNSGKPVMQNGMFFRAPDFSVFGEYLIEDEKGLMSVGGTSNAAAVTSAIIAQYYSIMPCWSTMDMKRFINATLKPAKDIDLEDKWTKTKKYLSYSEKIFDKNFLRNHNINVCKN
jgi:hypothetical protein